MNFVAITCRRTCYGGSVLPLGALRVDAIPERRERFLSCASVRRAVCFPLNASPGAGSARNESDCLPRLYGTMGYTLRGQAVGQN